ncbi:MAG: hypothetical protein M3Q08_06570, partial [Pseudomonadota bacterium]|nr:hypothetical protein [Pseudomonadota bacterium]
MRISHMLMTVTAAILMQVPATAASPSEEMSVGWTIAPAGSRADQVQFEVEYASASSRSQLSRPVHMSELEGLSQAQLGSTEGRPVRFRIAREAGTLDCTGIVRQARGTGGCRFSGSDGFADAVTRLGIDRPNTKQLFHLAMAGVGTPLLKELDRQGYAKPTLSQLVGLGIHGADLDYLR